MEHTDKGESPKLPGKVWLFPTPLTKLCPPPPSTSTPILCIQPPIAINIQAVLFYSFRELLSGFMYEIFFGRRIIIITSSLDSGTLLHGWRKIMMLCSPQHS